jgi:hypothetical protein
VLPHIEIGGCLDTPLARDRGRGGDQIFDMNASALLEALDQDERSF